MTQESLDKDIDRGRPNVGAAVDDGISTRYLLALDYEFSSEGVVQVSLGDSAQTRVGGITIGLLDDFVATTLDGFGGLVIIVASGYCPTTTCATPARPTTTGEKGVEVSRHKPTIDTLLSSLIKSPRPTS